VVSIGARPFAGGPRRGDIHFLAFRDIGGNVLDGPHPAVVVPMTSAPRSGALEPPYLVPARESGLERDGWVKADRLFTIPSAELGERAGRLSPDRLAALDAALRFVLGL
jgi:mRNA-degrading endonuclease toxin of MazEF toxin-antitoxin module